MVWNTLSAWAASVIRAPPKTLKASATRAPGLALKEPCLGRRIRRAAHSQKREPLVGCTLKIEAAHVERSVGCSTPGACAFGGPSGRGERLLPEQLVLWPS